MFRKGFGVERDDSLAYALYLESVNGPDTPDVAEETSYRGMPTIDGVLMRPPGISR
jgi:hypothetical protein